MRLFSILCFCTVAIPASAFVIQPTTPRSAALQMGIFDSLSKAFSNTEYTAPPEGVKATARHILVKDKRQIGLIVKKLEGGETFNKVAKAFSTCASASSGGSLGSFPPGRMVKEFDDVIFDPDTKIGEIVGPIQTQFGYHMIVVDKRTGVDPREV